MIERTKPEDCPKFEDCEANLCPLDREINTRTWFPDEPFCTFKGYQRLHWLKKQKKIAKIGNYETGYFTKPILDSLQTIKRGIKGVNPDLDPLVTAAKKIKTTPRHERKSRKGINPFRSTKSIPKDETPTDNINLLPN